MSNFWRFLDLPLICCEIKLDLKWTKDCVISEIWKTNTNSVVHQVETATTSATFQINNVKLYVSAVTLSLNDNIRFLENIKQGFKRTISWNKYRSEIVTKQKNSNLDYPTDPTFRNINRLFLLSFNNGDDDPKKYSFDQYYMPLVEIKDFNELIDNKSFLD